MSVVLGFLHPGNVSADFMRSVVNLLIFDMGHDQLITDKGGWLPLPAGPNLSAPRCKLVRSFLESGIEWLWMLDSDMTFPPQTLNRLMDSASSERPIVGGLCFGRTNEDGLVYFPTLFDFDETGQAYRYQTYPADTLIEVGATGTACLLIHRDVLVKMGENFPEPLPWFQEEVNSFGGLNGEDVTFCLRARSLGFPIYVDTGVKLGHVKGFEINEQVYEEWYERSNRHTLVLPDPMGDSVHG